jgi:hypothetical protein
MRISRNAFLGVSLAAMIAASPALSADLPRRADPSIPIIVQMAAVDGVNAKLSGFGGWIDRERNNLLLPGAPFFQNRNRSQGLFGAAGSLSVPLGERLGLQVDGLASSARGAFLGGGGAHLFTRDPAVGLIGAYGSVSRNNAFGGVNQVKAGAEAEIYLGRFTISGVAGWEQTRTGGVDFLGTLGGVNLFAVGATRNRFFDAVNLSYYPLDNWRLSVGHRYTSGRHQAAVATEYLFHTGTGTSVAAFVEGRFGQRGNNAVFGGISFYFGQKDKTLIRRHREDDPPNWLLDSMYSGGANAGGGGGSSGRRLLGAPTVAPPPPPPPPPSCPPYCGYT